MKRTRKDGYTQEHIDYLYEIADETGKTNKEIHYLMNKKFNENRTVNAVIGLKSRLGIKSYLKVYTVEQLEYLRKITPGRSNKEITELFNKKYNDNRTEKSISSIRIENDILNGRDCKFKKGNIPDNHLPIGTELIREDGYLYVKVDHPNVWKTKHRIIWEKVNGEVPKDYVLLFGDSNRMNFDINNIILISRKQLLGLNRNDLIHEDIELTKTGINIVNIKNKISEVSKRAD